MRMRGFAVAAAGAVLLARPATAEIRCNGPYQLVQGQELATPYCQDGYLARVAREYGMRVSASAVRYNPNVKREVCRFIGRDIRVQQICVSVDPQPRGAR
jgi:hypothetical protein